MRQLQFWQVPIGAYPRTPISIDFVIATRDASFCQGETGSSSSLAVALFHTRYLECSVLAPNGRSEQYVDKPLEQLCTCGSYCEFLICSKTKTKSLTLIRYVLVSMLDPVCAKKLIAQSQDGLGNLHPVNERLGVSGNHTFSKTIPEENRLLTSSMPPNLR